MTNYEISLERSVEFLRKIRLECVQLVRAEGSSFVREISEIVELRRI